MFDKEKKINENSWWQPAVEVFTKVSSWIAAPIILALIVGKALDKHFDTKPTIFLICAGVGFLVSIYGIFKEIRFYMKKIENMGNKENGK